MHMAILSFRLNTSTDRRPLGRTDGPADAHGGNRQVSRTRVEYPSPTAAAHLATDRQTVRPRVRPSVRRVFVTCVGDCVLRSSAQNWY